MQGVLTVIRGRRKGEKKKSELDPKEKRTEPGRFVSWVGWVKRSGWVGYNRIDYSRRINQMAYIRSRFKASGAIGSKIKGQET
jgi:hypothetical protein